MIIIELFINILNIIFSFVKEQYKSLLKFKNVYFSNTTNFFPRLEILGFSIFSLVKIIFFTMLFYFIKDILLIVYCFYFCILCCLYYKKISKSNIFSSSFYHTIFEKAKKIKFLLFFEQILKNIDFKKWNNFWCNYVKKFKNTKKR